MNTTRSEAVDWPYDQKSDQVHQEQERDRERVQEDIKEAWIEVCKQLPLDMKPELVSACHLIEWQLGVK
jgi:hypothetical protein